jgi:hypothetical protein
LSTRTLAAVAIAARHRSAVVIGAALAGLFWGATGFVALLDPGPDPGPVGSATFYLIEGGHALGGTGMFVALIGLWRSQASRTRRVGKVVFGLAAGATLLLAVLTYLVVVGSALGLGPSDAGQGVPEAVVAVASAAVLLLLIAIVVGYIGSGVTTTRAGVWPRMVGWLLMAYPVLLFVNFFFYPIAIATGALWAALAWVARSGSAATGRDA